MRLFSAKSILSLVEGKASDENNDFRYARVKIFGISVTSRPPSVDGLPVISAGVEAASLPAAGIILSRYDCKSPIHYARMPRMTIAIINGAISLNHFHN